MLCEEERVCILCKEERVCVVFDEVCGVAIDPEEVGKGDGVHVGVLEIRWSLKSLNGNGCK